MVGGHGFGAADWYTLLIMQRFSAGLLPFFRLFADFGVIRSCNAVLPRAGALSATIASRGRFFVATGKTVGDNSFISQWLRLFVCSLLNIVGRAAILRKLFHILESFEYTIFFQPVPCGFLKGKNTNEQ